jgi:hypothetical protein
MANDLSSKIWSLDTALGVVTTGGVYIHSIQVRFTTAGAGSFQMLHGLLGDNTSTGGDMLIDATSTATSTANAFQVNQTFTYGNQWFAGLKKTLCVNVEAIYIVTCNPM